MRSFSDWKQIQEQDGNLLNLNCLIWLLSNWNLFFLYITTQGTADESRRGLHYEILCFQGGESLDRNLLVCDAV
jgi:hypothetical protein